MKKYISKTLLFFGFDEVVKPGEALSDCQIKRLGGEEGVARRPNIEVVDSAASEVVPPVRTVPKTKLPSPSVPSHSEEPKMEEPASEGIFTYNPEKIKDESLSTLNALCSESYQDDCERQGIPIDENNIPYFRRKADAIKYLSRDFKG